MKDKLAKIKFQIKEIPAKLKSISNAIMLSKKGG